MTKTDLVWFLIAGLIGAIGGYERVEGRPLVYGRSLAWATVALFAFLALLGVITNV